MLSSETGVFSEYVHIFLDSFQYVMSHRMLNLFPLLSSMYHKECLLKWMKAKHDFCPYCREYAFPVEDFVSIAKEQVGEERFKELVEQDDEKLVAMYLTPNDEENQQIKDESAEKSGDSPQDTEEVIQEEESIQKDDNSCFP